MCRFFCHVSWQSCDRHCPYFTVETCLAIVLLGLVPRFLIDIQLVGNQYTNALVGMTVVYSSFSLTAKKAVQVARIVMYVIHIIYVYLRARLFVSELKITTTKCTQQNFLRKQDLNVVSKRCLCLIVS